MDLCNRMLTTNIEKYSLHKQLKAVVNLLRLMRHELHIHKENKERIKALKVV